MSIVLIIVLLLFTIFCLLFFVLIIYNIFFASLLPIFFQGAFFAKTKPELLKTIISLLEIKPGQKAVDIGSGDGRLVISLAEAGAMAYGYEINPFLVFISRRNIKKKKLQQRAFIYRKNFWKADLSHFDLVTVYGVSYMMKSLEEKLNNELKPGAKIASNYFIFRKLKPLIKKENIYIYKK